MGLCALLVFSLALQINFAYDTGNEIHGGGVIVGNTWTDPVGGEVAATVSASATYTLTFDMLAEAPQSGFLVHIGSQSAQLFQPSIALAADGGLVVVATTLDSTVTCTVAGVATLGAHNIRVVVEASVMRVFVDHQQACRQITKSSFKTAPRVPLWLGGESAPATGVKVRNLIYRTTEASDGDLALGKETSQSSTTSNGVSARAVDGVVDVRFSAQHCTHTHATFEPWWKVDLGAVHDVRVVQVVNRGDCCHDRLDGFQVRVGNDASNWKGNAVCNTTTTPTVSGDTIDVTCDGGSKSGRYVYIALPGATKPLTLCNVKVFGDQQSIPARLFRSTSQLTWDAAQAYCKQKKGRLAVLDTPEKMWASVPMCRSGSCGWIGGRCPDKTDKCGEDTSGCKWFWMNIDDSKLASMGSRPSNWGDMGPASEFAKTKFCAFATVMGEWAVEDCEAKKYAVCEYWQGDTVDWKTGLKWHLEASSHTDGAIKDVVGGMTFTEQATVMIDGVQAWDVDHLERTGGPSITLGKQYTFAVWINWRKTDAGWRTVLRGDQDHCIVVQSDTRNLGFYSNRNGQFRDTISYDISAMGWQLVVVTGVGDCAACSVGTSRYYLAKDCEGVKFVGSSDRVGSGTAFKTVGYPGQPPGAISEALYWDRIITDEEMQSLFNSKRDAHGLTCEASASLAGIRLLLDPADNPDTQQFTEAISGMSFTSPPVQKFDGVHVWDISKSAVVGVFGQSSVALVIPKTYTFAFWVFWKSEKTTHRVLGLTTTGSVAAIEAGGETLGYFKDTFVPCGHKVNVDAWNFVVVVGRGDCQDCATGKQIFYVGSSEEKGMEKVGEVSMVATGSVFLGVGVAGHGAGNVAMAGLWGTAMTLNEVKELWNAQKLTYGYEPIDPPPAVGRDETIRHGMVSISWSSGSACSIVSLQPTFGAGAYHVQAHISHRDYTGDNPHAAATVWIEEMKFDQFRVCVRDIEPSGTHNDLAVEWIAYQQVTAAQSGEARVSRWREGNKCVWVSFPSKMTRVPSILATLNHRAYTGPAGTHDATILWIENVTQYKFRACLKSVEKPGHDNAGAIMWLAYAPKSQLFESQVYTSLTGETSVPPFGDSMHCAAIPMPGFNKITPEVVLTLNRHHMVSTTATHSPVVGWVESVIPEHETFVYCVENIGAPNPDDTVHISWLVVGEIYTPPTGSQLVLETLAIHDSVKTRMMKAIKELSEPAPEEEPAPVPAVLSGRFTMSPWSTKTKCQSVEFAQAFEGRPRDITVQLTPSFPRTTNKVHEPKVVWVETVTNAEFKVCASSTPDITSGNLDNTFEIEWIAASGTPAGTEAADEIFQAWTASKCQKVLFGDEHDAIPNVQVTINHRGAPEPKHPVTAVWVEDVTMKDFTICVADKSGQPHDNLRVSWMAYSAKPAMAREVARVEVAPIDQASKSGECTRMSFVEQYASQPTVLATLNHVGQGGKEHDAPVVWIEEISKEAFVYCVRSFAPSSGQHTGMFLDYLVRLPFAAASTPEFQTPTQDDGLRRGFWAVPKWDSGDVCQEVVFFPPFTSEDPVHVQLTISHRDTNGVHDAVSSWVEYIDKTKFRACLREVPNPGGHDGNAKIEWLAYQHVVSGSMGEVELPSWSGTHCQVIKLEDSFTDTPHIQATLNHRSTDAKTTAHPAILWIEQITSDQFMACTKTAMSGTHDASARISYLAFKRGTSPFPVPSKTGELQIVPKSGKTECSSVGVLFDSPPIVKITVNHGVFQGEEHHAPTVAWVEGITTGAAKICVQQVKGKGENAESVEIDWIAVEIDAGAPVSTLDADRIASLKLMDMLSEEEEMLAVLASRLGED